MIKGLQPRQKSPDEAMSLSGFPHGLNTVQPADRIAPTELSECVNWMLKKGGTLSTRPCVAAHSTVATTGNAAVKTIATANIGGTLYTLLTDANHKLYYMDANLAPQLIGTLEGEASIMSYNGVALLLDGSYIKYLDGVSAIKIAYDSGGGLTGLQFDNLSLSNDTFLALGNGTNERVGQKFTSQAWTSGYTIPLTAFSVYLSKVLTPTGTITIKLRKVADDSILASKTLTTCAAVSGTASKFTAYFTASDITTQMSPSIAYYISVEYAGGDAANYIKVHTHTESSAGLAYHYAAAAWTADATHNCLCSVSPGRPPKGKFAAIWNKRPWVHGDPDKAGALWYGNLSHLDWSTTDGGGYLPIIDDDSNNFEVGAIASFYGNLYVFGTQAQPYLVKISGANPSEYVQETAFQKPWTTSKLLASAMNDLWYAGNEGVSPLSGVQEYGDLRTFFASDSVLDRLDSYWSTATAFAAYFPESGQYWLIMPSYHRILVCHTKQATQGPDGGTRYPWVEYEFYRDNFSTGYTWAQHYPGYYLTKDPVWGGFGDPILGGADPELTGKPDFITIDGKVITEGVAGSLGDHQWSYGLDPTGMFNTVYLRDDTAAPGTYNGAEVRSILLPTCLVQCGDFFLMGGSDGFVYKMDLDEYKDMSTHQITPVMSTAYMEVMMTHANFSEMQALISSKTGGRATYNFFTDGAYLTPSATKDIALGLRDNLTVYDMTMDVEDAYFSVETSGADNPPLFDHLNFNARSVMVRIDGVIISGSPIFNSGIILKHRRLGH